MKQLEEALRAVRRVTTVEKGLEEDVEDRIVESFCRRDRDELSEVDICRSLADKQTPIEFESACTIGNFGIKSYRTRHV